MGPDRGEFTNHLTTASPAAYRRSSMRSEVDDGYERNLKPLGLVLSLLGLVAFDMDPSTGGQPVFIPLSRRSTELMEVEWGAPPNGLGRPAIGWKEAIGAQ